MNSSDIIQAFLSILPAVVVGYVAYYFFTSYVRNEQDKRIYQLKQETHKELLPYRIQALERMTLFLERIHPGKLMIRVSPETEDKFEYENALVASIESEFEHNLTQQIYLSAESWEAIRATKNATITLIRRVNMNDKITTANKLREAVLTELIDKPAPSITGLAYIKKETKELW